MGHFFSPLLHADFVSGHNSAVPRNFASSQYILETSQHEIFLLLNSYFPFLFFHGVISREKRGAALELEAAPEREAAGVARVADPGREPEAEEEPVPTK